MPNNFTECTNIWISSHAVDATVFDRIVPISAIFTCDYGSDVKQLEQVKSVFSWEKKIHQKHSWSNFHVNYLLHDELADGFIGYVAKQNGIVNLLCYAPSGLLEKLLESMSFKAHVNYCSISIEKKLFWDDKILFHPEIINHYDKISTKTKLLGFLEYTSLSNELSETFVIKLPVGSAGNHTFIVNNQNDLDEVQHKYYSYPALIQRFEKAIPINIQGVVQTTGVTIYPPSIQIIGTESCSFGRFDWCGNDFHTSNFLSLELIEKVYLRAQGIGAYLKDQGYLGIFGLDMLVNHESGNVYFLELNPRFQGSTSLLSQLEIINGIGTNIICNHINAFTGIQEPKKEFSLPLKYFEHGGSQVILHNKHRKPCIVNKSLQSGIYTIDKNKSLQFIRPGFNLLDCVRSEEFVISYGTPIEGELVVPGAPLLWVQLMRSVLANPAIGKLTSKMESICSAIYSELECVEL